MLLLATGLLALAPTALAGPRVATPHADDEAAHLGAPHWVAPPHPRQDAPPPSDPTPDMTVYAYHAYWGDDPTQLHWDQLTHVAIFDVVLDGDGTLSSTSNWTDVAADVVAAAHAHGVKVDVCVTSFDGSTQSAVLTSPERRSTAVAALAALVNDYGADGVNVDVEAMDDSLSGDFVQFITELHASVDEVYIATPAVDWLGAYDYSELAANSEGLFIMGYGYYWTGGGPGPNDPLYGGGDWSTYSLEWSIEDYETYGAPVDKIVLGLPLYGQEWPADHDIPGSASDDGWSVVMSDAVAAAGTYGANYEPTTHSDYTLPPGDQLWYDDNDAIRERIAFARDQGLQGVGFWAVGYEGDDADFWPMVAEETTFADTDSDTDTDTGGGADNGGTDDDPGDSEGRATVVRGDEKGGCAVTGLGDDAGLGVVLATTLLARRRSAR